MSGIASQEVVATHTVRGLNFEIERTRWRGTSGESYDVRQVETRFALHNESFDDKPTVADIEGLIEQLQDDWHADALDSFFDEREVLEFLFSLQPKVELIHSRDPDSECDIEVYVNGERVKDVTVEDIDPGRGYDRDTITERREEANAAAEAPGATAYEIAVAEALNGARFEAFETN